MWWSWSTSSSLSFTRGRRRRRLCRRRRRRRRVTSPSTSPSIVADRYPRHATTRACLVRDRRVPSADRGSSVASIARSRGRGVVRVVCDTRGCVSYQLYSDLVGVVVLVVVSSSSCVRVNAIEPCIWEISTYNTHPIHHTTPPDVVGRGPPTRADRRRNDRADCGRRPTRWVCLGCVLGVGGGRATSRDVSHHHHHASVTREDAGAGTGAGVHRRTPSRAVLGRAPSSRVTPRHRRARRGGTGWIGR